MAQKPVSRIDREHLFRRELERALTLYPPEPPRPGKEDEDEPVLYRLLIVVDYTDQVERSELEEVLEKCRERGGIDVAIMETRPLPKGRFEDPEKW